MSCEMVLVEQFEVNHFLFFEKLISKDVIKEFERNYTEICGSITEYGQSSFARIRELEGEFHEKFSETILGIYERLSKGDIDEVDDDIREVFQLL